MKEVIVYGTSLPQAYHKALMTLKEEGEMSDCAD
jgi:hypothetical protein